jgi:hypothetical protein
MSHRRCPTPWRRTASGPEFRRHAPWPRRCSCSTARTARTAPASASPVSLSPADRLGRRRADGVAVHVGRLARRGLQRGREPGGAGPRLRRRQDAEEDVGARELGRRRAPHPGLRRAARAGRAAAGEAMGWRDATPRRGRLGRGSRRKSREPPGAARDFDPEGSPTDGCRVRRDGPGSNLPAASQRRCAKRWAGEAAAAARRTGRPPRRLTTVRARQAPACPAKRSTPPSRALRPTSSLTRGRR